MHPTFRRLGADDVQVLANVAGDIFDHEIGTERAARFLADARNILIVALEGERVIGQLTAVVHQHLDAPPDLFLENLGVTEAWRRRGVARRLIALAFAAGARQGAEAAWVGTEEDNEAAQALYRATGASGGRFMMFSYADLRLGRDAQAP